MGRSDLKSRSVFRGCLSWTKKSSSRRGGFSTGAAQNINSTGKLKAVVLGAPGIPAQDKGTTLSMRLKSGDWMATSFRELNIGDRAIIEELHKQWFPIRYNSNFYDEACGGKYRTICCVNEQGGIVGCLIGQFVSEDEADDAKGVLPPNKSFFGRKRILGQVLTIGVVAQYRGQRIGEKLLSRFAAICHQLPSCGAIFLHVLTTNTSAIRLYERFGFVQVSLLRSVLRRC